MSAAAAAAAAAERKKGVPWTEEEHKLFLQGLAKFGKGDWRNIARTFVMTRTPTQVRGRKCVRNCGILCVHERLLAGCEWLLVMFEESHSDRRYKGRWSHVVKDNCVLAWFVAIEVFAVDISCLCMLHVRVFWVKQLCSSEVMHAAWHT